MTLHPCESVGWLVDKPQLCTSGARRSRCGGHRQLGDTAVFDGMETT